MATKKFVVHSYPHSPSVAKAAIAGKFGGVEIEYAPGFEMGKTNKTEEFIKKNPAGQVPVLDTPEGSIFESTAIAYFVARSGTDAAGLLGATPFAQSQVDQWVHFARSRLEGLYPLFAFAAGWGKYDQANFDETLKKVHDAFAVVETHFNHKGTKFLVGDRVTLADIVVISGLFPALRVSLDEEALNKHPKVKAYIHTVLAEPHVKSVIGEIAIPAKFTPPQ